MIGTVKHEEELHQQYSFAHEIFHSLSQPLTALLCSLELSLSNDGSVEELRATIQDALANAERLRQRLVSLRELTDAGGPADSSRPTVLKPRQ